MSNLTPSKVRRAKGIPSSADKRVVNSAELLPGHTVEQWDKKGVYGIRATRSKDGDTVVVYKKFFGTKNWYIHRKVPYLAYLHELAKPENRGQLSEIY